MNTLNIHNWRIWVSLGAPGLGRRDGDYLVRGITIFKLILKTLRKEKNTCRKVKIICHNIMKTKYINTQNFLMEKVLPRKIFKLISVLYFIFFNIKKKNKKKNDEFRVLNNFFFWLTFDKCFKINFFNIIACINIITEFHFICHFFNLKYKLK